MVQPAAERAFPFVFLRPPVIDTGHDARQTSGVQEPQHPIRIGFHRGETSDGPASPSKGACFRQVSRELDPQASVKRHHILGDSQVANEIHMAPAALVGNPAPS